MNTARRSRNQSPVSRVESRERSPHPALAPHPMRGEGGLWPGEGCMGQSSRHARIRACCSADRNGAFAGSSGEDPAPHLGCRHVCMNSLRSAHHRVRTNYRSGTHVHGSPRSEGRFMDSFDAVSGTHRGREQFGGRSHTTSHLPRKSGSRPSRLFMGREECSRLFPSIVEDAVPGNPMRHAAGWKPALLWWRP